MVTCGDSELVGTAESLADAEVGTANPAARLGSELLELLVESPSADAAVIDGTGAAGSGIANPDASLLDEIVGVLCGPPSLSGSATSDGGAASGTAGTSDGVAGCSNF